MTRRRTVLALLVLASFTLLVGMMVEPTAHPDRSAADGKVAGEANRAISARLARPHRAPIRPESIDTRVVAIETRERSAGYFMTDPEMVGSVWGSQELATPKSTAPVNLSTARSPLSESTGERDDSRADSGVIVPATTFAGPTIDDDKTETGLRFIPPDPIGAAGPDHLVSVINVLVNFYRQDGTADLQDSLFDFEM